MASSSSSPQKVTVFLTGASRGIGLAIAEQLLDAGHRVATLSRTLTPELKALGARHPSTSLIIQGDVADTDASAKAVAEAAGRFGGLDAVILNSALGTKGTVRAAPLREWRACFEVNVFGMLPVLQAALPLLDKSPTGSARIVLVSSGGGVTPGGGLAPYSASKAAVNSLARSLGVEEPSITTMAVHPGLVLTDMLKDMATAEGVVADGIRGFFNAGIAALEESARPASDAEPKTSGERLVWPGTDTQVVAITPKVSAERLVWLTLHAPKEFSGKFIDVQSPEIEKLVYAS